MADLPRTQSYLLTAYATTGLGLIDAQDGRDLIRSVFGWQSVSDPTADNDSADTAGLGVSFSIGSEWINTNAQHEFICVDDRPGIAVWESRAGTGASVAYVDSHDAAVLLAANTHSDAADAATLAAANAVSAAGDVSTLAAAAVHSDTNDTLTLASANAHSDAADAVTLATANAHSDAADIVTLSTADAHIAAAVAALPGSLLVESGASAKISALPAAGALAGTEPLVAVQAGADVKVTLATIATYIGTTLSVLYLIWGGSIAGLDSDPSHLNHYFVYLFYLTGYIFGPYGEFVAATGGSFV